MAASDKDTIYIDVDDEITGIIDKLRGSKGKVVALVLPKRATVFQSIVNMKLLKRAADASSKNAVLITSEAGLLPLAGVAGVHVAKTLNSKPEIPQAPAAFDDAVEAIGEDGQEVDTPPDPKQTIGALADKEAAPKPPKDGVETLTLAPDDVPAEDDLKKASGATGKTFEPPTGKKGKKDKNKKLKVPNFERFRLLIIIGVVLLILLIIGFIFASVALPKATITIKTNATNVDANLNLNLSTTATSLDPGSSTVPAKLVQQQKTATASEVTTGQKNEGNTASGTVMMTATENGATPPSDVPAGTGLSANGLTYITQGDTSFSDNGHNNHDGTFTYQATSSTPVTAQTGGASYNGASTFTVAGRSDVSAQVAQAISGGTDNIVQTVNQNDINNAKAKINLTSSAEQQTLINQLQQDGYFAIKATYSPGTPTVTSSANVGSVANTITVTEAITYTMFGAHRNDLSTLIANNVDGQINTSKQSILDDGLSNAVFSVNNSSATGAQLALSAVAVAGPQLNTTLIKQQSEGQKTGQIENQLQSNPNVTGATVHLSPFWITTVPKNPSRITVNVAKPTTTAKASSNANNP
jgi:hypothetical protein